MRGLGWLVAIGLGLYILHDMGVYTLNVDWGRVNVDWERRNPPPPVNNPNPGSAKPAGGTWTVLSDGQRFWCPPDKRPKIEVRYEVRNGMRWRIEDGFCVKR